MKSARPVWKGSLKLSLISIPIRVYPATTPGADVSFRQLHRKCHTPIQLKKWCPHCQEMVEAGDIVKGYETSKDRYVMVEEEDIARLRPASTHVVDLSHVIDASTIDPIHVERSYYVMPDSKAAGAPFAVMREALDGQAAVGRVALHGREYLVAIKRFEQALMMYTLRTRGEVRELSSTDGVEFSETRVKPDEVKLARQVLGSLKTTRDLSSFTDNYEEALRAMLEKKSGGAEAIPAAEGKSAKVVDLMQALRQSLASITRHKQAASREPRRKMARVVTHPSSRRKVRKAS